MQASFLASLRWSTEGERYPPREEQGLGIAKKQKRTRFLPLEDTAAFQPRVNEIVQHVVLLLHLTRLTSASSSPPSGFNNFILEERGLVHESLDGPHVVKID